MKMIGYARVSTSGQTLDAQLEQLGTAGCDPVFRETMSGARNDRPELKKALAALSEGDVLVVTRLDRLARSTRDLLDIVHTIETQGAKLKALADSWADTTTPTGKLILTVLGGLAEFERSLIAERTAEGRDRARRAGRRLGRPPKLTQHQREAVLRMRSEGQDNAEIARVLGVSRLNSTIDTKAAFLAQAELPELRNHSGPVVFIDDIIGSGRQAVTFITELTTKYPEFAEKKLAYCTVAGFEDGTSRVKKEAKALFGRVFSGREFAASERAFSEENPIWYSTEDRERAKSWARELGKRLTGGTEHALGWEGTEGLIVFSYNTPNNTLPIFWHNGNSQFPWNSLFDRF